MSQKSEVYKAQVVDLIERIETALTGTEWATHRRVKNMRDEAGIAYQIPTLTIGLHATRIVLDPYGFGFTRAEAGADLYFLPPYDTVGGIYLEEGTWFIYSAGPPFDENARGRIEDWAKEELTEESIRRVLGEIVDHAVPSV